MKKSIQKRISLLVEAREYVNKMQKGSVFVTDFKAARLIEEMISVIQEMLSENLKLRKKLKVKEAFEKSKEKSK